VREYCVRLLCGSSAHPPGAAPHTIAASQHRTKWPRTRMYAFAQQYSAWISGAEIRRAHIESDDHKNSILPAISSGDNRSWIKIRWRSISPANIDCCWQGDAGVGYALRVQPQKIVILRHQYPPG